jgi:hypothetical protein
METKKRKIMGEAENKLNIKKALFAEHPEEFILRSEVIIGILKNQKPSGEIEYSCMVSNATALDLCTAYGLITGEFVKMHLLFKSTKNHLIN